MQAVVWSMLRSINQFFFVQNADERLLEYDVDRVVANVRSPFQLIQILHTANFGNLLVLDGYQSNSIKLH